MSSVIDMILSAVSGDSQVRGPRYIQPMNDASDDVRAGKFWPVPDAELIGETPRACPACLHAPNLMVRLPGEPGPQRAHFDYVLCNACGTLAIAEVPADLGHYYGEGYYSFGGNSVGGVKRWLKIRRDANELFGCDALGALLGKFSGTQWRLRALRPLFDGSLGVSAARNSSFLDIGCGAGTLLRELAGLGFTKLTGADLFVPAETHERGLDIFKADLGSLTGKYDVVMFHHSFEHIPEPEKVLQALAERMAPKAIAVIRIPLGASFGWFNYGGNWAQLDPPRHLYLFSVEGFQKLVARTGFSLRRTEFDSTGDFFVWSEMRRRGLSEQKQDGRALFSKRELAAFDRKAATLNAQGRGEQATFFLSRD